MSDETNEEPKLIIDEDYKSQVEREKAEYREKQSSEPTDEESNAEEAVAAEDVSNEVGTDAEAGSSGPEVPLPPASFEFLITSLATQAMASLGQIPGEDGKPMPKNLNHARHFIDLLGVLEEKTKGNLGEDEDKFLQGTLHQMRMIFVQENK